MNDIGNHWAKLEIEKLFNAEILSGYGDGSFKPDQEISREEMVVILLRMIDLSLTRKDSTKGNFADMADASTYAAQQIKEAAEAGIISGKSGGIFDPKGKATRAEALTVILNLLKLDPQIKSLLDKL